MGNALEEGLDGYAEILKPIKEAVDSADSLEELDQMMFKLYKKMNGKKLEDILGRTEFNAQLFGLSTGDDR